MMTAQLRRRASMKRDGGIRTLATQNTIELPYVLLLHEAMGRHRHQTFHDILRSWDTSDRDSIRELRDVLNGRRIIGADSGADFPTPLTSQCFSGAVPHQQR